MAKIKQTTKVLNWLKTRGELTTRVAVAELNIMSLPKIIEDLCKEGVRINMTYRMSPNGTRYGVYTLAD